MCQCCLESGKQSMPIVCMRKSRRDTVYSWIHFSSCFRWIWIYFSIPLFDFPICILRVLSNQHPTHSKRFWESIVFLRDPLSVFSLIQFLQSLLLSSLHLWLQGEPIIIICYSCNCISYLIVFTKLRARYIRRIFNKVIFSLREINDLIDNGVISWLYVILQIIKNLLGSWKCFIAWLFDDFKVHDTAKRAEEVN